MAGRTDGRFDLVLAIALLHHLTDDEALAMFESAESRVKDTGRLVTLDCAWTVRQHPVSKLLIGLDRGRNTRTPSAYEALAKRSFGTVETVCCTDLNWFPYTHCKTCRA